MYDKIVNPVTNRKVKINSKIGKSILMNYFNKIYKQTIGGGQQQPNYGRWGSMGEFFQQPSPSYPTEPMDVDEHEHHNKRGRE